MIWQVLVRHGVQVSHEMAWRTFIVRFTVVVQKMRVLRGTCTIDLRANETVLFMKIALLLHLNRKLEWNCLIWCDIINIDGEVVTTCSKITMRNTNVVVMVAPGARTSLRANNGAFSHVRLLSYACTSGRTYICTPNSSRIC